MGGSGQVLICVFLGFYFGWKRCYSLILFFLHLSVVEFHSVPFCLWFCARHFEEGVKGQNKQVFVFQNRATCISIGIVCWTQNQSKEQNQHCSPFTWVAASGSWA
jgi:hypothetical protein